MLEARGASFHYPGREALFEGVDVAIEPGERVAILGLNGSGKSTFLRCLAGITPLAGGRVLIDGYDTAHPGERPEALARIGFLFESPEEQALAPTVEREIAFGLENRGVERSSIRSSIDASLERFGLTDLAQRHPSTLSGGERQRLALASVFVEAPRYLFLDEPTSRLDAAGREVLAAWLESLTPAPAIIEVTLRREQAKRAHRVFLVSKGTVRECGAGPDWDDAGGVIGSGEVPALPPIAGPAVPVKDAGGVQLRAEHLAFTPRGAASPIFRDVSLEIFGGQALIITGPTGSGKTTLLRMLARFEKPSSGLVSLLGSQASGVAFMPQFPERLLFGPTVLADIAFAARRAGASGPAARAAARECLARVDLDADRLGSAFPGDLSYGERRRVALAGLLSANPRVLLLDEPEVGLDAPGRKVLRDIIAGLLNHGTGVAVASHEAEWLSGVPGRKVLLEKSGGSRTVVAA